jgi:hypothetical protein
MPMDLVVKIPDVYVAPKFTGTTFGLVVILTMERARLVELKTNDPVAVLPSPKVTWSSSNVTTAACTGAGIIARHAVASNAIAPQVPKLDRKGIAIVAC